MLTIRSTYMQRFHSSHSCNFLVGKSSTEVSLRHFFAGGCAWLQHRALRLQLPRVGWSRVFWQALLAGEQAQEPVGFATNKEDHLITGNHRNWQMSVHQQFVDTMFIQTLRLQR